jgi:DNA-binding MarR family transcriptional regulator
MLKALERLGLVQRVRDVWTDRRQLLVWLTDAGRRCILQARGVMVRAMRKLVYVAICFGQHRDESKRLVHMETLEGYLRSLRSTFGDKASLYYPWGHPDD